ncbi:vesicle-associated membrane protein 728 [Arabidopsis thaliana]|nr:vesicle-associated membrane protein 728 [Arabidopsis thaliana]AEE76959.1 vesicle-associated membrane protein 728 [Arabidopsis thaliana]|eukprot:NP_001189966.1 vesicle-associated membrane protein 728 [Arabidopsis thaliana]
MVVDRNGYNYLTQQLEQRVLVLLAHPEEISKLAKVKALVTKMKGVMMENIEKALDRSEKIKILVDLRSKYSNLPFPSYGQEDIITPGTKITRKMWFQNMKFKLIVLGTSSSRFVLITERRRRLR